MFLDMKAPGEPWGGGRLCHSCKQAIDPAEPVEELRFESGTGHRLEDLNGTYHVHCAKPLLSVKRAFDALGRFSFG